MFESPSSDLARTFQEWSLRGCGWDLWDVGVELEPSFSKLRASQLLDSRPVDDARLPRGISVDQIGNGPLPGRAIIRNQNKTSTKPKTYYREGQIAEFEILPSPELNISPANVEQFLLSLGNFRTPISFEIVASYGSVHLQFACEPEYGRTLINQTKTFFPKIAVIETRNRVADLLSTKGAIAIADFGLARPFILPINTSKIFDPDPLRGLIGALSGIQKEERALFQILFTQARGPWTTELRELLQSQDSKNHLSINERDITEKLSSPFFAVSIRLAVIARDHAAAWTRLRSIGANLVMFSKPNGNELIALDGSRLTNHSHLTSLLNRFSYRSGMLLNANELAGLIHLPSNCSELPNLKKLSSRTKKLPTVAETGELVLGTNEHEGCVREVRLTFGQRVKHMHLIGATGSGKSTLLVQMMTRDAENGGGFAAFDPHGDLIDSIVERIPESRLSDVILFDPGDAAFPVGLNLLAAHSEVEKTLLSSDLVSIIRRFSTSWGDVMNSVLSNAVLAFLESDRGGSLLDLKRFLVERTFREDFLTTVRDDEIRYYWRNEFTQLRGKPYAPLLTRLDSLLRSKSVRNIVAQRQSMLDFRRIMDDRKILLVRLSHGALGIENAYILGSLLVAKLHHAALSRQDVNESERTPFFLYLDEAHNFITESMSQILTGARKYGLGLVISHQQLGQFRSSEADILGSILSNCYSRICFRLDEDAEKLSRGFSFFDAEQLRNLGVGEAICRFEQSQFDFNLKTSPLVPIRPPIAEARRKAVVENTRSKYARHITIVEGERKVDQNTQSAMPVMANVPDRSAPLTDPAIDKREITPRGGQHHRELQAVIKRMGESLGFNAVTEKVVLNRTGSVDVSLEKDQHLIACEVSVSTVAYEAVNAQKCLDAGYSHVFVVASNRKKIPLLQKKIASALSSDSNDRVSVVDLPGLLRNMRALAGENVAPRKNNKNRGSRLSFNEACELLGVTSSTLYRWIRDGKVPFYRPGREYQFDREELLLAGKNDLSDKRKSSFSLPQLEIGAKTTKSKKQQDDRYKKMLKLD